MVVFTGMIDHGGTILECRRTDGSMRIRVSTEFSQLQLGESIAVDGCCLTVVELQPGSFEADLSSETVLRTIAAQYTVGSRANLERALRMGDRIGGHWVSGHVDGAATVLRRTPRSDFLELTFRIDDPFEKGWLFPKGSIAINGVSLTVNAVDRAAFSVMIIPHTAEKTTLADLNEGTRVNIEFDLLAKSVCRQVAAYLDKEKV